MAVAKDTKEQQDNAVVRTFRETRSELRKVVWPTQQQLITYFIVVMVFVVVMMTIISLLDLGFGSLAFAVFG